MRVMLTLHVLLSGGLRGVGALPCVVRASLWPWTGSWLGHGADQRWFAPPLQSWCTTPSANAFFHRSAIKYTTCLYHFIFYHK